MVREVLVETDFLFGLSAGDKLHSKVIRVLEKHRRGEIRIVVSSASPLEATLALISHGIEANVASKAIKLMIAKLAEYRANTYAPITLNAMVKALELKMKYNALTFFDSIHISLATTLNIPLLTSDALMMKIMEAEGIEHLSYETI